MMAQETAPEKMRSHGERDQSRKRRAVVYAPMAKNTPWPSENWPPKPAMMFQATASPANRYVYVMMFSQKKSRDRRRKGSSATSSPTPKSTATRRHVGIPRAKDAGAVSTAAEMDELAIQFCSRKPTSSAPTWPNSPVGRTISTARKMRNQMACLSSGSM